MKEIKHRLLSVRFICKRHEIGRVLGLAGLLACHGILPALSQDTSPKTGANPTESVTLNQALDEAIRNNLGLLAAKVSLTIAEAARITASLRPNPVVSVGGDHLDWLGTGFDAANLGGPPEMSSRVDFSIERGGKRRLRMATADLSKEIAEANLFDAICRLKQEISLAWIDVRIRIITVHHERYWTY